MRLIKEDNRKYKTHRAMRTLYVYGHKILYNNQGHKVKMFCDHKEITKKQGTQSFALYYIYGWSNQVI